ncbi:MAG: AMP-binding protein, partial [Zoogloea sp.]|nr:AMP-binding protein [Zoogloea sp.]
MALALGRLVARESPPGEKVGLLLPNLAPTLGLIFGLSAQGRTAAMLNYTAGVEACGRMHGGPSPVHRHRGLCRAGQAGRQAPALQGVRLIYLEDLRATMRFTDTLWLLLWALPFPRLAVPAGSPEDAAVVLFTSGSEGKPKGVVLSHRALLANVAQIRAVVDFSIDDKILNALPLFHSFGLTAGGLLPVLTGARVFLYPSPLHYRVIPELA